MPSNPTYDDWMRDYRANTPGYQAPGGGRLGSTMSPTGGYKYTPGQSGGNFVQQNVKQDFNPLTSGGAANFATAGWSQPVRAIGGYRKFKKAQANDRKEREGYEQIARNVAARAPGEYLNAYDPTSRTSQYARERNASSAPATPEELQAVHDQEEVDNLRKGATSRINDYFRDPSRSLEYERLTQDQLRADTQNIGTTFDNADTKARLNAARQGLTGGSVEAENSAALGGQRSAALVDAAQGANKTFSNLTARDRAVQDQLLSLVNSDDPYMRQAATAQLQGMQQQTANDAYQSVADQTRREAGQFNENRLSQNIGSGLSGLTSLIQQDPNRGTNLSAWYTPARN